MELLIQFTGNQKPLRVTVPQLECLIHKLQLMRTYQKHYFTGKQDVSLKLAKQYENEVDSQLDAIINGEQSVIGF